MTAKPWYREPWPWIVMAGPAIVVVAGIATAVIAVRTSDGMVADDYYKQGLAINRVIERDARAAALGVSASVQFGEERDRVRVLLAGAAPRQLRLTFVHPTRAGADQTVLLTGDGIYEARMAVPQGLLWHVRIEDADSQWRLSGDWRTRESTLELKPR